MTSPSTQNLKTLGLWVFFLICCSNLLFLLNVRLRLTLEYLTQLRSQYLIRKGLSSIKIVIFFMSYKESYVIIFSFGLWIVGFQISTELRCWYYFDRMTRLTSRSSIERNTYKRVLWRIVSNQYSGSLRAGIKCTFHHMCNKSTIERYSDTSRHVLGQDQTQSEMRSTLCWVLIEYLKWLIHLIMIINHLKHIRTTRINLKGPVEHNVKHIQTVLCLISQL